MQRAQPQLLLSEQRLSSLRAVRLHHASVSVRTRNARRTGNTGHAVHAQQVLTLVNRERAANGLSALRLDDTLSRYAAVKSQDMHDNGYFSHTSPTYGSPFDMMKSFGITYNYAGENIAMGYSSPEAVMTAWMNSAGHRANILSANFTTLGVGYGADGGYWTQWFIG